MPIPDDPCGVDATILEGWLDLKVRNDTEEAMQIELTLDGTYYYGRILVSRPPEKRYDVINQNLQYIERTGKTYESVDVIRRTIGRKTDSLLSQDMLYTNVSEIGYDIHHA
jgi:vancomycin resistance protein VanW